MGPGFVGKQYGFCSDNVWHLVLAVMEDSTADTQCCADVKILPYSPGIELHPICQECWALQFGAKDANKKVG